MKIQSCSFLLMALLSGCMGQKSEKTTDVVADSSKTESLSNANPDNNAVSANAIVDVPYGRWMQLSGADEDISYPWQIYIDKDEIFLTEVGWHDAGAQLGGSYKVVNNDATNSGSDECKKGWINLKCQLKAGMDENSKSFEVNMRLRVNELGALSVSVDESDLISAFKNASVVDFYDRSGEHDDIKWPAYNCKTKVDLLHLLRDVYAYEYDEPVYMLCKYLSKPSEKLSDGAKGSMDFSTGVASFEWHNLDDEEYKLQACSWDMNDGVRTLVGVAKSYEDRSRMYFYIYDKSKNLMMTVSPKKLIDLKIGNKACEPHYSISPKTKDIKVDLVGLDQTLTYKWNGKSFDD